jgi:cytochrome c-type protein NapC
MHSLAPKWGKTCIDCHKGIAHELPRDFDDGAMMGELHERMEKEGLECRQCHEDMVGPPKGEGW